MCGRFALKTPSARVAELMHFDNTPAIAERYNIAPSQEVLAVREVAGRREGCMMRWGLIPSWAKDPAIGNRMINARAESLDEKPSFRESFRHRRCLIPADGFYEWQAEGGKGRSKQPYFIHRADGQIMALAGIWDNWISPDGEEVLSCAIITIDAGPDVSAIHSRMPTTLYEKGRDVKTES
jgi:putative SOS response-associated peptidase YedK